MSLGTKTPCEGDIYTDNEMQDRRQITMMDLVEPASPSELAQLRAQADDDEGGKEEKAEIEINSSAKIKQLIKLLDLTPGNEKSLVFSQFTSFLDKVSDEHR